MKLEKINVANYEKEKQIIHSLLAKIWTVPSSLANVEHSVDRWGQSKNESGEYFYIVENEKIVGVTGYYIPNLLKGEFGLRHHGVIQKGMGKKALDLLVEYLRKQYGNSFQRLIELVPPGRMDLVEIFQRWGFELVDEPVPAWEPKREYYQYVLILKA